MHPEQNPKKIFQRQSVSVAFRGATVGHKRLTVLESLWHVELSPTSLYYWIYMYDNCCITMHHLYMLYISTNSISHLLHTLVRRNIYIYNYYFDPLLSPHVGEVFRAEQADVKVAHINIFLSEDALVETKLDWISFQLAWISVSVWFNIVRYVQYHILWDPEILLPEHTC